MPPRVFSILTSPMVLLAWLFTFLSNSRFAGIASLRVALRSGSAAEEYHLDHRGSGNASFRVTVRNVDRESDMMR